MDIQSVDEIRNIIADYLKYYSVAAKSMTTTERDALSPSDKMIIYNSTTTKFQGYNGATWVDLS
jgi:hypothetical protein